MRPQWDRFTLSLRPPILADERGCACSTTETSESREVPPPADDAGLGETHQADAGSSRMEHGMLDTGYKSEGPGYAGG